MKSVTASTAEETDSMHRCLAVADILRQIVECCPKPTLAALAAVCTSFSEQALNSLWKKQSSLGNLVRCLPSRLWTTDEKGVISVSVDSRCYMPSSHSSSHSSSQIHL